MLTLFRLRNIYQLLLNSYSNPNIFANYQEAILNNILEGYLSENGYDLNITHREMFTYFSDLETGSLTAENFAQILELNCSYKSEN